MLDIDGARTTVSYRPVRARASVHGEHRKHSEPVAQPAELVTVPARRGLEAVDILRLGRGVGPVLHDVAGDTLGFLVPPGTAARWQLPGSACTPLCGLPQELTRQPPVNGTGWLIEPDSVGTQTTEAARLHLALIEASRTLEAADRCE